MNSSVTVKINPRHLNLGTGSPWFAKLVSVAKAAFIGNAAQNAGADNVRRLLAKAAEYDKTQPSYAADLRAAATAFEAASNRTA